MLKAAMKRNGNETGMEANGIAANAAVTLTKTRQKTYAINENADPRYGTCMATNPSMPNMQEALTKGTVSMLASGAATGNCEKAAMLRGKVNNNAAKVIASGSAIQFLNLSPTEGSQAVSNGVNNTIPNVENAERANDNEHAAEGSTAINITIAAPKEDKAYERLRTVNETRPMAAIALARKQDTGNPTRTRYVQRNRS